MDKKIDLDQQHSSNDFQKHIKIDPNSTNSISINLKNIKVGQNRSKLNNTNTKNKIEIKRHTTYNHTPNLPTEEELEEMLEEEDDDDEELTEEEDELAEEDSSDESSDDNNDDNRDDNKQDNDENKDKKEDSDNTNETKNDKENLNDKKIEDAKRELKDKNSGNTGDASSVGNQPHGNPTGTGAGGSTASGAGAGSAGAGAGSAGAGGGAAGAGAGAAGAGAGAAGAGAGAAGAGAGAAGAGGGAAGAGAGAAGAGGIIVAAPWILIVVIIILLVLLIVSMIIVILGANISYNSEMITKFGQHCPEVIVYNNNYDCSDNSCETIEFEKYISGVVSGTVDGVNKVDYYSAVAVIARTYVAQNIDVNCKVSKNNFPQYMDVESDTYSIMIKKAVDYTEDEVLTENGQLKQLGSSITTDWGINKTEALSLINDQEYSYKEILEKYFSSTIKIEDNSMLIMGTNGFINPVRNINCSSPYGKRNKPEDGSKQEHHTGIDLVGSLGDPIFAASEGEIIEVVKNVTEEKNEKKGYGNYIRIKHKDKNNNEEVITLYAHMKHGSIPDKIVKGYQVKRGEQIGQIGQTGRAYGYHLHYEVRKKFILDSWDWDVNPNDYMNLSGASGTCKAES